MQKTIEIVTRLARDRVIGNYAIAGAVAALNYIQPTLTEDLDILISVDSFEKTGSSLLLLGPIEKALAEMGYTQRMAVGYMIEGWPVQFLPVSSPLDEEALAEAIEVDISGSAEHPVYARCLSAEHVVATATKVGRINDLARIQAFLDQGAVDLNRLKAILEKHNLMDAWRLNCFKIGIKNPLN